MQLSENLSYLLTWVAGGTQFSVAHFGLSNVVLAAQNAKNHGGLNVKIEVV